MQTSATTSPGIRIEGIAKRYGGVVALDEVNLEIAGGEFMTLLGPSGSGKSTLLMALAGFVRPDGGNISIGSTPIVTTPPHRRNIGMVFQRHALFPHMSVYDNIAYPLRLRGVDRKTVADKVDRVLALVRLEGYQRRRVDQLSGGQSQRVAVARAIVFSPQILLMDEPLSALDKNLREQMQTEIRALHDELKLTTVYVTHDQREALTMSDRVAVMARGRVAQVDSPRAIFEQPADSFVAQFIGETTLVPVTGSGDGFDVLGTHVRGVALPAAGRKHFLVLRPGALELCDAGESSPDYVYFSGRTERPIFEGESVVHQVVCAGGVTVQSRALARTPSRAHPGSGEPVTLRLHRSGILLVPEAAA